MHIRTALGSFTMWPAYAPSLWHRWGTWATSAPSPSSSAALTFPRGGPSGPRRESTLAPRTASRPLMSRRWVSRKGPRGRDAQRERARGSLLGFGAMATAVVPTSLRACAAGTLPVALAASPCAGRGRLPASSAIKVPTSYCVYRARAWASSQGRALRSRKAQETTRGAMQGSGSPQEGPGDRRSKK